MRSAVDQSDLQVDHREAREHPGAEHGFEAFLDRRNELFRHRAADDLILEYEATTGERVTHWQRRLLARYTRNLALAGSELMADIFDLTVAARGIVDDNFAYHPALGSARHRFALRILARTGELERLIAWYSR